MLAYLRKSFLPSSKPSVNRSARPLLENLEDRLLLYSAYGGTWAFGSRITYSFMPDGTSVGGTPSALFQTMNAKFATATWEAAIEKAASVWEAVANINLALVSDNGSPEGCNGDQQDDPRFGDIRIGAVNLGTGALGETFLPPPFNGGTVAGDIFLNSNPIATWNINSAYDLETVAIHEFGHALGLGESQITTACMYAYYNGTKQSLTTDDIAGIQSVWGAPQPDQFNSNGQSNSTYTNATNLNGYIAANGQVAIPSLDITNGSQAEWFSVTVPSTTSGTFVATVQSLNLSSLSPKVYVYTTGLSMIGSASSSSFGATVSVSIPGVQAGQTYLVRANGNAAGSATGGFGLELNFGSVYQPPIAPPNTVVPQQPDQSGGGQDAQVGLLEIGNVTALGYMLSGDLPNNGSGIIQVPLNPLQLSVQTSVDQSSATDGLAALVAGTNIAQLQLIGGGVSLTATGSQDPSTLYSGSTPSILQVVDYLIMNWNGQAGLLASIGWNASNGSLPYN
ncbi:MAG: matrixin family metalloprotease [Isosphaeraceae bacterium]